MTYCNYKNISDEVNSAASKAGRAIGDVQLIAVSKTVGNDAVAAAIEQGATHFAENRPDCLIEKAQANPQVEWHFIGNIQSRRIPDIVQHAHLIHSLYKIEHAEKIDRAAEKIGKTQKVLVEVNISGEESKAGCSPDEAASLVLDISKMQNVCVCGLMTMAPIAKNEAENSIIYETFEGLRILRDTIRDNLKTAIAKGELGDAGAADAFVHLSMGMSGDWREAIECGATMVRIGRAIFQPHM